MPISFSIVWCRMLWVLIFSSLMLQLLDPLYFSRLPSWPFVVIVFLRDVEEFISISFSIASDRFGGKTASKFDKVYGFRVPRPAFAAACFSRVALLSLNNKLCSTSSFFFDSSACVLS